MKRKQSKPTKIHNMGIGHFIPKSMSKADYTALKQKWDEKLEASKFVDIEEGDAEGFVGPVFTKVHGNTSREAASRSMRSYTPEKAEFYRQCSIFLSCFNFKLLTKKAYPRLQGLPPEKLKEIWRLYSEGYSREEIAAQLPPKWGIIPRQVRTLVDIMRQISATFNRTDPNGGNYDSDF